MSPFVGGAFGSGLRPQYEVVLAVLGAQALKRSVRVVLTREQMYGLGYRPATIERVSLGAKKAGTLDAIMHEATAITSQFEEFSRNDTAWSEQLYKSRQREIRPQAGAARPSDAVRHAGARRRDRRVRAGMRDGRACHCAQDRSDGAAPAVLFRPRAERRPALHQQAIARMLSPGRGGVRLGQAQSRAALDARRRRSGRVGDGDRYLGSAADADGRPHRAHGNGHAEVSCATSDIGTGTYTIMAQVAADMLGLPIENVTVKLGNSTLPRSPVEGGSWTAASVAHAIASRRRRGPQGPAGCRAEAAGLAARRPAGGRRRPFAAG